MSINSLNSNQANSLRIKQMHLTGRSTNSVPNDKNYTYNEAGYTLNNNAEVELGKDEAALIKGAIWDDQKLASIINWAGEVELDLSNTINWSADGSESLTPLQIDDLKNRFDVNNLDRQGFYDLLASLSNMNAVSAGDVQNAVSPQLSLKLNFENASKIVLPNGKVMYDFPQKTGSVETEMPDYSMLFQDSAARVNLPEYFKNNMNYHTQSYNMLLNGEIKMTAANGLSVRETFMDYHDQKSSFNKKMLDLLVLLQ